MNSVSFCLRYDDDDDDKNFYGTPLITMTNAMRKVCRMYPIRWRRRFRVGEDVVRSYGFAISVEFVGVSRSLVTHLQHSQTHS